MNKSQLPLPLIAFACLWIGQALPAPEYEGSNIFSVVKKGYQPSCRSALSQCLKDLDSGKAKQCEILPVPRRSFLKQIAQGSFELRRLRSGVWMYNDGVYLSLILKKGKRLVLIDSPDSAGSNTDTGSGTLLTDAIENVLGNTIPTRIDMVYSHAHLDHIGSSQRVFEYVQEQFPHTRFVVWGSQETKELVEVHKSNRAVKVNEIVMESGRTLQLSRDLKVRMMIVGGHTQEDLVIFVPKSSGQKGIVFFVDVVNPRWSPTFNLELTQDIRDTISAHRKILNLNFDILVPGHLRVGTKKDVRRNLAYIEDLLETTKMVPDAITPQQIAEAGIGRIQDPNAREYRNLLYGIVVSHKLQVDACYRIIIEKWGCRLAGLDLFLRSHCSMALFFIITEY